MSPRLVLACTVAVLTLTACGTGQEDTEATQTSAQSSAPAAPPTADVLAGSVPYVNKPAICYIYALYVLADRTEDKITYLQDVQAAADTPEVQAAVGLLIEAVTITDGDLSNLSPGQRDQASQANDVVSDYLQGLCFD